jgi:hypothetical protein
VLQNNRRHSLRPQGNDIKALGETGIKTCLEKYQVMESGKGGTKHEKRSVALMSMVVQRWYVGGGELRSMLKPRRISQPGFNIELSVLRSAK